jgi:hypothetical protein
MPLEITCTGCQKRLRIPDKFAGKRVKCPKCQAVLQIPKPESADAASASPQSAPEAAASSPPDRWYLKTEDGEDYGPVPKKELDQWFDEGRVTADSQILRDGSDQWQWASDVYPQLESTSGPAPPSESLPHRSPAPAAAGPDASPGAFDFAAGDASPTLRATGKRRVRKVVKRTGSAAGRAASRPAKSGGAVASGEQSPKSKLVAGLLGIFLGGYGVHRFYLGYTGMGLVMLFTCGGCGIWSLIDAIMILTGKVPDPQGRPLRD